MSTQDEPREAPESEHAWAYGGEACRCGFAGHPDRVQEHLDSFAFDLFEDDYAEARAYMKAHPTSRAYDRR